VEAVVKITAAVPVSEGEAVVQSQTNMAVAKTVAVDFIDLYYIFSSDFNKMTSKLCHSTGSLLAAMFSTGSLLAAMFVGEDLLAN